MSARGAILKKKKNCGMEANAAVMFGHPSMRFKFVWS